MNKPILHFAHANSYPAGTYGMFFDQLGQHYDVRALPMHAHNPKYPVDDGWRKLGKELGEELAQRYRQPVILVGHSMGGILSLLAGRKRPDLVRCVVLLDSPIVAGWRASAVHLGKVFKIECKRSPAVASIKRRNAWPDIEAAYQHYAAKAMFAAWPERVLRDYVTAGIEPEPSGGANSVECRLAGLAATKRLVGPYFRQIPGGHLFPMESPEAAAGATHEMIQALLSGK